MRALYIILSGVTLIVSSDANCVVKQDLDYDLKSDIEYTMNSKLERYEKRRRSHSCMKGGDFSFDFSYRNQNDSVSGKGPLQHLIRKKAKADDKTYGFKLNIPVENK